MYERNQSTCPFFDHYYQWAILLDFLISVTFDLIDLLKLFKKTKKFKKNSFEKLRQDQDSSLILK